MATFVYRVQVEVPDDLGPRVSDRLRDPERLRHLVAACLESEIELPWGLRVGLDNVSLMPTRPVNPSGCVVGL